MSCLNKVLFFRRVDCKYSEKIEKLLKKYSKKLVIFNSSKPNQKINNNILKNEFDYIFCFRSFYILKEDLLKNVKNFAINFHPGPPKYRGIGSYNFALFDNEKKYGCTAHIINNSNVDNGPILKCKHFKIPKNRTLDNLIRKTHNELYILAVEIITSLYKDRFNKNVFIKKNKYKWSKKLYLKRDLDKLFEIKCSVGKKDFKRNVMAINYKKFKPFIILHNKKFIMN